MFCWLKKLKLCITKNNSNGEEMKKKPYKFEMIGKLKKKHFSHFHRNQRLQKALKN